MGVEVSSQTASTHSRNVADAKASETVAAQRDGEQPEAGEETKPKLHSITVVPAILIPVGSLLTGGIRYLLTEYYAPIGVNYEDLGISLATILANVTVALLYTIGLHAPLLFAWAIVTNGMNLMLRRQGRLSRWLSEFHPVHGIQPKRRLVYPRRVLASIAAVGTFVALATLATFDHLILSFLIAPVVIGVILANMLMKGTVERTRWLPTVSMRWAIVVFIFVIATTFVPPAHNIVQSGPDLRPDGPHGGFELSFLGVDGQPVQVSSSTDGADDLGGMLRLGHHGSLYVLYDPCNQQAVYVPVKAVNLHIIDEVDCGEADTARSGH